MLCEEPRAVGNVYNVGNTTPISIMDLAVRVIERTDSDSRICLVPYDAAYPDGFEELGRRQPDTSLLRELTGWRPLRTLDDAIDDVIAYERIADPQPVAAGDRHRRCRLRSRCRSRSRSPRSATAALTPAAIRLALRTRFMDRPVGYKGHGRPTPYLGGVALAGGVSAGALVAGAATSSASPSCCAARWGCGPSGRSTTGATSRRRSASSPRSAWASRCGPPATAGTSSAARPPTPR